MPRVVADRGRGRRDWDGRGRAEGLTGRVKESVSSMTLGRVQRRGGYRSIGGEIEHSRRMPSHSLSG